ncbi:hypothetical protein FI667_g9571, partial [Globisporangium splendens]
MNSLQVMTESVARICEQLHIGNLDAKRQVLRSLRSCGGISETHHMIEYEDARLLRLLMELVGDHEVEAEQETLKLDIWETIAHLMDLLPSQEIAAHVAGTLGFVACVVRYALQRRDGQLPYYTLGLTCLLSLKKFGVQLAFPGNNLIETTATMLTSDLTKRMRQLLVQVLRILSAESTTSAKEIEQIVRNRLQGRVHYLHLCCLESVLLCYEPKLTVAVFDPEAKREDWFLWENAEVIIQVLLRGHSFEKCVVLMCMCFAIDHMLAREFVSHDGISALFSVVSCGVHELQQQAVTCLAELATLDAKYRSQIVMKQVEREQFDILSEDFYKTVGDAFSTSVDFEFFKKSLGGDSEAEKRQALVLLPTNIEALAVFCFDHGLISMLSALLADVDTSDYVKHEVWQLLVHIIYELPRVGVAKLRPCHEKLASLAFRCLAADCAQTLRKQAFFYLTAPLNQCASVRDILVNDEAGVPRLVEALSHEGDPTIASLLSDFTRNLATANRSYASEVDLVVRGLLDNAAQVSENGAPSKIYYQNLLSVYRKSERVVLGHAGADEIENLKLSVEILSNGSEVEKMIVLMQFRKLVPSWGPIQLRFLCDNVAALACVLVHEPDKLRQIAIDVLKALAQVGSQYHRAVLDAQTLFWSNDPIIVAEVIAVNEQDEADGADSIEDAYEYSDDELDVGVDVASIAHCDDHLLQTSGDDQLAKKQRLE